MNEFRSVSDLLELAIRVERCLLDFYKRMHDHIQHSLGTEQFATLAAAEQAHIVMLRRFLDSCSDDESKFNLKREQNKSQNDLVSHAMRIFNRAEEMTKIDDALDALCIGTESEIESILFFTALSDLFFGEQHDLIAHILHDEESHLLKLIAITKKTE